MKKIFSIFLIFTMIFVFTVPSYATATSWDTSDQANLLGILRAVTSYGTGNLFYKVSHLDTTLTTIATDISTIKGYLYDSGHSIGYYISNINSWMSPIYNSIINSVSDTDIQPIIAGLNEVVSDGGSTSYTPYLKYNGKSNANWLSDIYTVLNLNGNESFNPSNIAFYSILANGGKEVFRVNTTGQLWPTSISQRLAYMATNQADIYTRTYQYMANNYNTSQTALNWTDIDSSYTFTPSSVANGIYSWFATIQVPVARLSYVLASDERIEAQEAAAPVEQEVVDDFIDSSGDASVSPSDIGSIADLSAGYKQNFGSTASVTGIFNIFDSNNFGWFSFETEQQLDTTTQTRNSYYATPLLDRQLEEINNALGVTNAN